MANLLHNLLWKSVNVDVLWIPSHEGIVGNSLADMEAKKGLSKAVVNLVPTNEYFYVMF